MYQRVPIKCYTFFHVSSGWLHGKWDPLPLLWMWSFLHAADNNYCIITLVQFRASPASVAITSWEHRKTITHLVETVKLREFLLHLLAHTPEGIDRECKGREWHECQSLLTNLDMCCSQMSRTGNWNPIGIYRQQEQCGIRSGGQGQSPGNKPGSVTAG